MTRLPVRTLGLGALLALAPGAYAGAPDELIVTVPATREALPPMTLEDLVRRADAVVVGTLSNGAITTLNGNENPVTGALDAPRMQTILRFERCRVLKDHPHLRLMHGGFRVGDEGGGQFLAQSRRIVRFPDDQEHFRVGRVYVLPLRWSDLDPPLRLLGGHRAAIDVTGDRPEALGEASVVRAALGTLRTPDVIARLLRATRTPELPNLLGVERPPPAGR